ncbi:MAG: hypothetical protein JSR53_12970 [Proteobacteria bacterium]|nr:hypothetical protein [Pseudomonadota bacterium]
MERGIRAAFVVVRLALVAGLALQGAAALAVSWSGANALNVADPAYGVTAFTVGVPTGWKFAGAVVRDASCHGHGPGLKSIALAPDGATAIGFFPGYGWSWTSNAFISQSMARTGCPGSQITSAADFLVKVAVPNLHPNARVLAVQPMPQDRQAALAQQLAQMRQMTEQTAAQFRKPPPVLTLDGAQVRVAYDDQGRAMEELLRSVVDCTETTMPGMGPQPAFTQRMCGSRFVFFVRAPQGQLDALLASPQLEDLSKLTRPEPAWSQRVAADQQRQFQQNEARRNADFQANLRANQAQHEAMLQRGRQFQQQQRQQFERSQAADRATVAAMQDGAHRQVLSTLGRQEFVNPGTGQIVQGSANYNHQWISSDGRSMIQNNDHQFNPNGVVNPISQSWTPLVPR